MAAITPPTPGVRGPAPLIPGGVEATFFAALSEYIDRRVEERVEARLRALTAQQAGEAALSVAEVAALKRRDPKTVRRWIREGLPATKRGGAWVVRRADLDRFIAGEGQRATSSTATSILASVGVLHPR